MRHTRTRRRLKAILTVLLFFALLISIEAKIETLIPELKFFAESKIEESLDRKIDISIGSLDGGIIHPFTLHRISIKKGLYASLIPSLEIDSIRTNYRVWDVLFHKGIVNTFSHFLSGESCIDIRFSMKDQELTGFVRVAGELQRARLRGYVTVARGGRIDYTGKIDDEYIWLDLTAKKAALTSVVLFDIPRQEILMTVRAHHLKVRGFDIVGDAIFRNRIMHLSDELRASSVEGEFETRHIILDYEPFVDIKSSYRVEGGLLHIDRLEVGDGAKASGTIGLRAPYGLDITVLADNVNLQMVFASMKGKAGESFLTGTMSGKFELKGPSEDSALNARLEVRSGILAGVLDFDHLSATLTGDGPLIRIEDSRIVRESGTLKLAGDIDLSKVGRGNIFSGVRIVSDEEAITWDELETKRSGGVNEMHLKKKMSDEVNLNFKKFLSDERIDESLRDRDQVEIEYKLHPTESLKMQVGQDKNFFGFEHKDRF